MSQSSRLPTLPWKTFLLPIVLASTVLLIAVWKLNLLNYDLDVPLYYDGDTLVVLMYIKGVIEGWPTSISHLSFPFGYPGAAFPIATSMDWLIIKAMSALTQSPGRLANSFWLLTLVLTAWSAAYASLQLGISKFLSYSNGIIYAFLPFALLRNVNHLNLDYYTVPLLCLLAMMIAGGESDLRRPRQAKIIALLACVVQGFNYIYFSYFACVLFILAYGISFKTKTAKRTKLALLSIALVGTATAANLLPTYQAWKHLGKPPELNYKSVAEAEVLGAKLRRMLVPHPGNPVPALAGWAEKDYAAHFPLENENQSARLGLFASLGFLLIVVYRLRLGGASESLVSQSVSSLGLATFLFITVGGFGALVNVLTTSDIRGLNRFSVFLAFFAIMFLSLRLSDALLSRQRGKFVAALVSIGLLVPLSVYDQLLDAATLLRFQKADTQRAYNDRSAVRKLENALGPDAAVLQLPVTGFPMGVMVENMLSYDHVRPYLWSNGLRWSWPSLTPGHRAWQTSIERLHGRHLVEAAALSGFDVIWISRKGYKDGAEELAAGLIRAGAKPIDLGVGDFFAFDIRKASTDLKNTLGGAEFRRRAKALLDTPIADWSKGFYDEERRPNGRRFRWSQKNSEVTIRNQSDHQLWVCLNFELEPHARGGAVQFEDKTITLPGRENAVAVRLLLDPREERALHFRAQVPALENPREVRQLYFQLLDFSMRPCSEE